MTAQELLRDHLYPQMVSLFDHKYYLHYSNKENWIQIGDLTDEELESLTRNIQLGEKSSEQCLADALKCSEYPNGFVGATGTGDDILINMGLSFENRNSMQTFEQFAMKANGKARQELMNNISGVNPYWTFVINKKTRLDTHSSVADYEEQYSIPSCKIDDTEMTKILLKIAEVRESCLNCQRLPNSLGQRRIPPQVMWKGKFRKLFSQGPAINTMYYEFKYSHEAYEKHRDEVLSVLDACLSMNTFSQVQKINKDAFNRVAEACEKIRAAKRMKPPVSGKLMDKYNEGLKNLLDTVTLTDEEWAELLESYPEILY